MIRRSVFQVMPIALTLFAGPTLAVATTGVNLVSTLGTPTIVGEKIKFQVTVKNIGDETATGKLRVKPFLMAEASSNDTAVLTNLDSSISLAPGAQTVLTYENFLPSMPNRTWWLGAILNPNWAIDEEGPGSRLDNTPDLVPAGNFASARVASLDPDAFDCYPEVQDENRVSYASISHELRAVARGSQETRNFPDSNLKALFGVANFSTHKVKLLEYNGHSDAGQPEKSWYSISWNTERDGAGKEIFVDYYPNNLRITNIAPGKYNFFTLLNSADLVPEANTSNNMEASFLDLSEIQTPEQDVVYIGTKAGSLRSPGLSLTLPFQDDFTVSANLLMGSNAAPVFHSDFTANDSANLSLTFPSLAVGTYSGSLVLTSKPNGASDPALIGSGTQTITLPVEYWVFGTEYPTAELPTQSLSLQATAGLDSAPVPLTLKNSGTAPLVYAVKSSKAWLSVVPSAGTVPPGQSVTMNVTASRKANLRADDSAQGSLMIQTNDPNQDSLRVDAVLNTSASTR